MHLPSGRSLVDHLRESPPVAELLNLVRAVLHREPAIDTSIAWEDGEVEDGAPLPPDPHG